MNDKVAKELARIMVSVQQLADHVAASPPSAQIAIHGILLEIVGVYTDVVEHRLAKSNSEVHG